MSSVVRLQHSVKLRNYFTVSFYGNSSVKSQLNTIVSYFWGTCISKKQKKNFFLNLSPIISLFTVCEGCVINVVFLCLGNYPWPLCHPIPSNGLFLSPFLIRQTGLCWGQTVEWLNNHCVSSLSLCFPDQNSSWKQNSRLEMVWFGQALYECWVTVFPQKTDCQNLCDVR